MLSVVPQTYPFPENFRGRMGEENGEFRGAGRREIWGRDKIADSSSFCLICHFPFLPLKRQFFPKNKPTPINLAGVGFEIDML